MLPNSLQIAFSYYEVTPEVLAGQSTGNDSFRVLEKHADKHGVRGICSTKTLLAPTTMLLSIQQLYGKQLGASDGVIGQVKDFYFDDQNWAVRYAIIDTGFWLPGRLVLISPYAFGSFTADSDCLPLHLTKEQIANSPTIESDKPVSRQFEEEFYRYYGWPSYWGADGMWGVGGFPVLPSPHFVPIREENQGGGSSDTDDPHLRSTQSIRGYHIQTEDGTIGHVSDFMIDSQSWALRHIVVETGHWYSGKEIVISPEKIERISFDESKVFVSVSKQSIENAPEYEVPTLGEA